MKLISGPHTSTGGTRALLFVLAFIAIPIIWLGMWCKKTPEEIHNSLWFLTLRVKVPEG